MLFVRMSLMAPRAGCERQVSGMMDQLLAFYRTQDGYVTGYKLHAADEIGDIGRVTVWRSQEGADATAQTHHVLSLRSDLMQLIEEGSDEERSFHADEPA